MTIRESLFEEWDREVALTRMALDAARDVDGSLVPAGGTRAIGGFVRRLAAVPQWGPIVLDRFAFDLDDEPVTDEAQPLPAVLEQFDALTVATRRLLGQSDAEWRAIWSLARGGKPQFSMPRVTAFRRFVLSRLIHRRGELSIALLAGGVVLPAFYVLSPDDQ